jgi:hypothetical protein
VKFTNLENQVSLLSAKETLTSHLPHCRSKYDTEARSLGVTWVRIHLKCKMSWLKKGRNFLHVWKVCFFHSCKKKIIVISRQKSSSAEIFQDPPGF